MSQSRPLLMDPISPNQVHHHYNNESNQSIRSRAWVYTLNNYGPGEYKSLSKVKCSYHVYAREVGKEGTRHIQGYIRFDNAVSRSVMSKRIPRAWVCKARGTPLQASNYCKKCGEFMEVGKLPMPQVAKGQCNKDRYKRVWDLAKLGDILTLANEQPQILISNYLALLKIKRDYLVKPPRRKFLDNIWVYGEPATGKSAFCESHGDTYTKTCNKWFMSYTGQKLLHVNDLGLKHSHLGYYLKLWADVYPVMCEDKNGGFWMVWDRVFVSSNYHPSEIWPDDKMIVKSILRRFHVIHAQRNNLVDTMGYLFVKDDHLNSPVCPDAPIGPGPGPSVFDNPPIAPVSPLSSMSSLADINIVINRLENDSINLSDVDLDIDIDVSIDNIPVSPLTIYVPDTLSQDVPFSQ